MDIPKEFKKLIEEAKAAGAKVEIVKMSGKVENEHKYSDKPIAKLSPSEIAAHSEMLARAKGLKEEMDRAWSKLNAMKDRWWADVRDHHSLHGKNVAVKGDEVFEILHAEEDDED